LPCAWCEPAGNRPARQLSTSPPDLRCLADGEAHSISVLFKRALDAKEVAWVKRFRRLLLHLSRSCDGPACGAIESRFRPDEENKATFDARSTKYLQSLSIRFGLRS
jgi:hypothetical protein